MLKIKTLDLENIGRFTESQTLDFSKLQSLVQVDAINKNTGGSSGSGKTTVFMALEYLFGINDVPNGVLQSRITDETIRVSATFDWDGKPVFLSRSRKSGPSINVDGIVITGSNKLTEEKLDEIIGIPRHLFRPLLHKRQKEGGFFLNFTPKETYEFLMDCLGLSRLRKHTEALDDKLKKLEEGLKNAENENAKVLASLNATSDAISSVGSPPIKEISEESLSKLRYMFEVSAKALFQIQKAQSFQLSMLEQSKPTYRLEAYDDSTLRSLSVQKNDLSAHILKLKQIEADRQNSAKNHLKDLKNKIDGLERSIEGNSKLGGLAVSKALEIKMVSNSICPTCNQPWCDENAQLKSVQLNNDLKSIEGQIKSSKRMEEELIFLKSSLLQSENDCLERKIPGLGDLLETLYDLEEKIKLEESRKGSHYTVESEKNDRASREFYSKKEELVRSHASELDSIRGRLEIDRRNYESANAKLKNYDENIRKYNSTMNQLKEREDKLKELYSQGLTGVEKIKAETALVLEVKRAVKSYASRSFDDALQSIGDIATGIIRSIPNMANSAISLEGTKETKEGKVKEEVNAVIGMDGELSIPIKSLSGGERTAVDLAVDLAVIDLIESTTGNGIDLIILDEPMEGLGPIEKEMVLEVLKNSSQSKRVMIVEHDEQVKQMVQSKVLVIREGLTSKIVCN
jgi:DNA repair exonuclease SbcCD ATPase subunit